MPLHQTASILSKPSLTPRVPSAVVAKCQKKTRQLLQIFKSEGTLGDTRERREAPRLRPCSCAAGSRRPVDSAACREVGPVSLARSRNQTTGGDLNIGEVAFLREPFVLAVLKGNQKENRHFGGPNPKTKHTKIYGQFLCDFSWIDPNAFSQAASTAQPTFWPFSYSSPGW